MAPNIRERVGDAASELKRRVGQDVRAGERAAREQTRRARRRVREVDAREAIGRGANAIATDPSLETPSSTSEEVAQRAAAAAEAPAPVDASLAPVTRPDQVQHNARAGLDGAAEMAMLGGGGGSDGDAAGLHAASEMAMVGGGSDGEEDGGQTPADMAMLGWGDGGEDDGETDEWGWF